VNDPTPLGLIVRALDGCGIPHMLTGSFASSYHGTSRTTADIDLVIDPGPERIECVVEALDPARFHRDGATARRAVERRDQFHVIDLQTGWKVDLVVRKDRPFSLSEMARRQPAEIMGVAVAVATAEDTILAKLEWAMLGGSTRQVDDAVEVLRVREDLDDRYLDRWAPELGVGDLLDDARRRAGRRPHRS
jgi:hypothetical protein